jgi:hypothetical protein
VHGTIIGRSGLPYSHCWVVVGGPDGQVIFDPSASGPGHYVRGDYEAKLQARPWYSDTAAEALERSRLLGDSGPWEYLDVAVPEIERTINQIVVARPDVAAWIARKRVSDPAFAAMTTP